MGDLWSDVLGGANSHGVTGGVYRAWVHIHHSMLIAITSDSNFMFSSCKE